MKIEFDYRFDTNGFFNAQERRDALEEAGRIWSEIVRDDFEAIPAGVEFTVQNPQTGLNETITLDREIDDLLIFVGASDTPFENQDLGETGSRTEDLLGAKPEEKSHQADCCCDICATNIHDLSRSTVFIDSEDRTGNLGVLGKAKYDGVDLKADIFQRRISGNFRGLSEDDGIVVSNFEPWAGGISIGTDHPQQKEGEVIWDFSIDEADLDPSKFDFISVALHEIGHILGIGTTSIFDNIGAGGEFAGVNARAVNNGSPVPLKADLGHIEEGFAGDNVLMDSIINTSIRNLPSDIDKALLADIGYEIDGFTTQGETPALATEDGENIFGATFGDDISALGGNDTIQGNEGDDTIAGGAGSDLVVAGTGNDLALGNENDDELQGSEGNDTLEGGLGNDLILGDEGEDSLIGNGGNDTLSGDNGNNTLAAFNDTLDGGEGNDSLVGEKGDDLLIGGEGDDSLEGGEGNDSLQGDGGNDELKGGAGVDTLLGDSGNDLFQGGEDSDLLFGGSGDDTLLGENGNDTLNGDEGSDLLQGGNGSDRFVFALKSGEDEIGDFVASEDTIEITAEYNFRNVKDVLEQLEFKGISPTGLVSEISFDANNSVMIFHDEDLTADNFRLSPLVVNDVTATTASLEIEFNQEIDTSVFNVFGADSADLTFTDGAGDDVDGSFVWDAEDLTLTFVPRDRVLATDTYTLTLASRDDGFISLEGELLDGDRNGEAGGDYIEEIEITASSDRILSVDDFVPELNANTPNNLDISLDNGAGVTEVAFTLTYNSQLLDLSDLQLNPDLTASWKIDSQDLTTPGIVTVSLSGETALNDGAIDLVSFSAVTPANATYGEKDILTFDAVSLNNGAIAATGNHAIQTTTSIGDLDGDGTYGNLDATLISQVSVGIKSGLDNSDLIAPDLIGDINRDGIVSAFDSYLATQA